MNTTHKPLLLVAGIATSFALSSCVVPYESSTTVRTYDPGYTVTSLPSGYRTEVISGTNYYYYNGNYYRRDSRGYVVVEAPRRSRYYDEYTRYGNTTVHNHRDGSSHVVDRLPSGYTTVEHRGQRYYRANDRYYRRQGSSYIVVASPF
ncbi:MAG: DUF6515 family protein [Luteolibacter sp.]